jgi:hypothetical protein
MDAYVSPTDHKDQAKWEGIHLTAGWFKGKKTEWFIEVTMAGQQWSWSPESLFSDPPHPELAYDDLDEHLKKVSKYTPQTQWQGQHGVTSYGGSHAGQSKSAVTTHSGPFIKGPVIHLPESAPDPRDNTIIVEMNEGEKRCRACNAPFRARTFKHARCYACSTFFIPVGKKWDEINDIRAENNLNDSLLVDPEIAPHEIHVWTRTTNGLGKLIDQFEKVLEIDGASAKK